MGGLHAADRGQGQTVVMHVLRDSQCESSQSDVTSLITDVCTLLSPLGQGAIDREPAGHLGHHQALVRGTHRAGGGSPDAAECRGESAGVRVAQAEGITAEASTERRYRQVSHCRAWSCECGGQGQRGTGSG